MEGNNHVFSGGHQLEVSSLWDCYYWGETFGRSCSSEPIRRQRLSGDKLLVHGLLTGRTSVTRECEILDDIEMSGGGWLPQNHSLGQGQVKVIGSRSVDL